MNKREEKLHAAGKALNWLNIEFKNTGVFIDFKLLERIDIGDDYIYPFIYKVANKSYMLGIYSSAHRAYSDHRQYDSETVNSDAINLYNFLVNYWKTRAK